ncbi:F0F1 ATP synthase subunit delta [Clostridium frigidicarnis]|uniref:ATP synthase subunit delta n=1 Tax=Clostridium frigidicarnis TaxID=84698 RepID=A0A1I0ZDW3_9CLOT|nr:F0F1 ATP synthase subunit delta [Clostridium frigidicarnis]SFB23844.1 ATP synthase F1 subcomplex delta subunit [Clostridium frigidicarnis]
MYEYLDRRYALALYQVAEEKGRVDQYLEDLRDIVTLIQENKDFSQIIKHPEITTSKKKQAFKNIFQGKIDDELLRFLLLLIEKDRILYLKEKLKEFEKIHLERQNKLEAIVKSVIPLDNTQRKLLKQRLNTMYNKDIILKEEIDEVILGGLYVRVGNDVIDGTIKSKLDEMKDLVLSSE